MRAIRTYGVTIRGFPEALYSARSPAKARACCFRNFTEAYDGVSFREFLSSVTVRRADNPPGIGERITVLGKAATRCIGYGSNRVWFMYDDGDVVLCAHPSDVTPSEGAGA